MFPVLLSRIVVVTWMTERIARRLLGHLLLCAVLRIAMTAIRVQTIRATARLVRIRTSRTARTADRVMCAAQVFVGIVARTHIARADSIVVRTSVGSAASPFSATTETYAPEPIRACPTTAA